MKLNIMKMLHAVAVCLCFSLLLFTIVQAQDNNALEDALEALNEAEAALGLTNENQPPDARPDLTIPASSTPSEGNKNPIKTTAEAYDSLLTNQLGRSHRFALKTFLDPLRYIMRHDGKVVLAKPESEHQDRSTQIFVVPGLAGTGISFEVPEMPGHYYRSKSLELRLEAYDGSNSFQNDATFIETEGLAGSGISFHLLGQPDHFLRYIGSKLVIDRIEDTEAYRAEVSFIGLGIIHSEDEDIPSQTDPLTRHENLDLI